MFTFLSRFSKPFALAMVLAAKLLAANTLATAQALPEPGDTPAPTGVEMFRKTAGVPGLRMTLNKPTAEYTDGDLLRVSIANQRSAYVYVFYHQANKQAVLLFPNVDRKHNYISARHVTEVPRKSDSLQVRIGAPFGREVVQVITSPRRIEAFETALKSSEGGVPVLPTRMIDEVCQEQAEKLGLVAAHKVVTTSERGAEKASSGAKSEGTPELTARN